MGTVPSERIIFYCTLKTDSKTGSTDAQAAVARYVSLSQTHQEYHWAFFVNYVENS